MPVDATIYFWPEIQVCQNGCMFAEIYTSMDKDSTICLCLNHCANNDGVNCPDYNVLDEDNDEEYEEYEDYEDEYDDEDEEID